MKFELASFDVADRAAKDINSFYEIGKKAWEEIYKYGTSTDGASLPEGLSSEYAPDTMAIVKLLLSGNAIVFSAKNDDGKIVGAQIWFLSTDVLNNNNKRAAMHGIYMEKEYRENDTFTNFLNYACFTLKSKNYNTYIGATPGTVMDKIIKKLNLKPAFIEYKV